MDTAKLLGEDNQAYRRLVRDAWLKWKNAGKEPSFEEASEYLKGQFPKAEHDFKRAGARLSDEISFLYWDVTENSCEALDYDAAGRQLSDLMNQAGTFIKIGVYKDIAGIRTYTPESVSTAHRGLQLVGALQVEERKVYLYKMTVDIVRMALRGHDISGMTLRQVVAAIYVALNRIRKEWKKK